MGEGEALVGRRRARNQQGKDDEKESAVNDITVFVLSRIFFLKCSTLQNEPYFGGEPGELMLITHVTYATIILVYLRKEFFSVIL